MKTGSCLCGGVAYSLSGELRNSVACHCVQCRKTSGHYVSATQVTPDQLEITRDDTLVWYQSSPKAQRGFAAAAGPLCSGGTKTMAALYPSCRVRWTGRPGLLRKSTSLSLIRATITTFRTDVRNTTNRELFAWQNFQQRPAWSSSVVEWWGHRPCTIWPRRVGPIVFCLRRTN